jgi:hypothetical protein
MTVKQITKFFKQSMSSVVDVLMENWLDEPMGVCWMKFVQTVANK